MCFVAGVRWQLVASVGMFFLLLAVCLVVAAPYRLRRMVSFMDPWMQPYGDSYQLIQSLIAFGRGGVWGVGLTEGTQKHFYLPEIHNDFIFASIGEELGLVGMTVVLLLYLVLVYRLWWWSARCRRHHAYNEANLCLGFGVWIACQSWVAMGVPMGLLPTKGITLPWISYGGSSLMMLLLSCGLLIGMLRQMPGRVR